MDMFLILLYLKNYLVRLSVNSVEILGRRVFESACMSTRWVSIDSTRSRWLMRNFCADNPS